MKMVNRSSDNVTVGSADEIGYDVTEVDGVVILPASVAANLHLALGIGSTFIR
jgi:hypothetical protein